MQAALCTCTARAQGLRAWSVPENGVTGQAGLRDTHGARRRRRAGFIARFILRGLATPSQTPACHCEGAGKGPGGWSFSHRAGRGLGEVACPQELGRLAHTLPRAGSRQHWRKLRTPPTWEASWQTCGSGRGWDSSLHGAQLLVCRGPGLARPQGSGSRRGIKLEVTSDLRGWKQEQCTDRAWLKVVSSGTRRQRATEAARSRGTSCPSSPSSSRRVRCKWGDSVCGSSSSCRSGRCWRS